MPTYQINPQPGPLALQQNQFAQQLILSGLDNMSKLEMAKKLQDMESANTPIEKVPTSELQKRHDKLAADLEVSRENALQSGDVQKLKAINKAENDLNYLGDELKKRAIKEMQQNIITQNEADLGTQKVAAEKALAAERTARASIFDKFGPGKDPLAGVKVTQKLYQDLVTERAGVQRAISGYTSKFMTPPQELADQLDALTLQIDEVKKRLGVKVTPSAPKAATKPVDVTGAPTDDLLKLLGTPTPTP